MALGQHEPEARALEKACDKAFAIYTEAAAVVDRLWKKASKIVFSPNTGAAHRVIDETNENYPEFAVAQLEKEEAFVEYQRAAHRHGNILHDVRK